MVFNVYFSFIVFIAFCWNKKIAALYAEDYKNWTLNKKIIITITVKYNKINNYYALNIS